jgi:hypothetical protein
MTTQEVVSILGLTMCVFWCIDEAYYQMETEFHGLEQRSLTSSILEASAPALLSVIVSKMRVGETAPACCSRCVV